MESKKERRQERGQREKGGGRERDGKRRRQGQGCIQKFCQGGGGGGAKLGYGKKRVGRKDLTINISYNINHSN